MIARSPSRSRVDLRILIKLTKIYQEFAKYSKYSTNIMIFKFQNDSLLVTKSGVRHVDGGATCTSIAATGVTFTTKSSESATVTGIDATRGRCNAFKKQ